MNCVVPDNIEPEELGILDPVPEITNGVRGASCLVRVNGNRTVPFAVTNYSERELTLPQSKTIAMFSTAEVDCPVDAVRTVHTNKETAQNVGKIAKELKFGLEELSTYERQEIEKMLTNYSDVFATSSLDLGKCDVVKHRIETKDAPPIYQRAYRVPYSLRDEMERQVQGLLEKDIIDYSKSPWGSPALLVQKADGSYRFVIDYRKLNSVTRVDPYPLPNIQETLSQLGSAKYFSVVDLASGFWQIEMDKEHREKTAFNTPSGHYEWKRMPMGLVNSPAVWQRTADVILMGLLGKKCFVYMDDIIIYSQTFSEHVADIEQILLRLRAAGLKLKTTKCQFLKREVKYLGHIVSADGVRPDPEKIECVKNFPEPQSVREVRGFLGLIGYYRRHIPDFAKIAKPLTALTAKRVTFRWTEEEAKAFTRLKEIMVTSPILRHPDFSRPFMLATDASQYAVGAVLSQVFEGHEHPVAYASRQLNNAEQKYAATERECLAVVWAVAHFRCYLYGRKFNLVTDCQALKWLMNVRDPSSRLARWNLRMQEYEFEVQHKPGKTNANADALSRAVPVTVVTEFLPSLDLPNICFEQRNDPLLSKTIKNVGQRTGRAQHDRGGYFLDQDQVLRFRSLPQRQMGSPWERIVVPQSLKVEVLRSFHDAPYSGHFGSKKTRKRIERFYYWPGMGRDIRSYCSQCDSCLRRKTPKHKRPAPLQVFEEVTRPFERTAMDIMGPLPVTALGNKYILVFCDHLTKYSEAIPLRDQKAETVAKEFVEKIVLRHGVPTQLLTDRGRNFLSDVMKGVCSLLGVSKLNTTAYHPECNGAVERLNQTIAKLLSHHVSRDQRDWDTWLPYAMFSYNTAVHDSLNETPFFLVHGRDPVVPNSVLNGVRVVNYATADDYKCELAARLQTAHDIAREALKSAAESRKQRYDRKAKEVSLKVGSRVYLRIGEGAPGLSKKLSPKWKGPYRVVERISPVNLKIADIASGKTEIVHANRLKPAPNDGPFGCINDSQNSRGMSGTCSQGALPDRAPQPPEPPMSARDTSELLLCALLEEEQIIENSFQIAAPANIAGKPTIKASKVVTRSQCRYPLRSRGGVTVDAGQES